MNFGKIHDHYDFLEMVEKLIDEETEESSGPFEYEGSSFFIKSISKSGEMLFHVTRGIDDGDVFIAEIKVNRNIIDTRTVTIMIHMVVDNYLGI